MLEVHVAKGVLMPISIDISDIRPAQRADPRFIRLLDFVTKWMNGPEFARARTQVFLHEACHIFESRRAGFEPELYGPGIDYFPDRKIFRWHPSSIEGLPLDTDVSMAHLTRIFHSPYAVCPVLIAGNHEMDLWAGSCDREILRDHLIEKITYDYDQFQACGAGDNYLPCGDDESIRSWYQRKSEPGFERLIEQARADISRDLRSPAIRHELWTTAWEFQAAIFPD